MAHYTNFSFYYLQDPTTGQIGYVGMTTERLDQRLRRHVTEAIRREHSPFSYKNVWLREILDKNVKPDIIELERSGFIDAQAAGHREAYWIKKMQEEGHGLNNMTTGGVGTPGMTFEHTEETKEKISEAVTKYNIADLAKAIDMRKNGDTYKQIYEALGMSRSNFYKVYKDIVNEAASK